MADIIDPVTGRITTAFEKRMCELAALSEKELKDLMKKGELTFDEEQYLPWFLQLLTPITWGRSALFVDGKRTHEAVPLGTLDTVGNLHSQMPEIEKLFRAEVRLYFSIGTTLELECLPSGREVCFFITRLREVTTGVKMPHDDIWKFLSQFIIEAARKEFCYAYGFEMMIENDGTFRFKIWFDNGDNGDDGKILDRNAYAYFEKFVSEILKSIGYKHFIDAHYENIRIDRENRENRKKRIKTQIDKMFYTYFPK